MSVTDVHECFTLYVDELPVTVDIVVYGVCESNYGADADGNRGINAWFVEDYEYTIPDASDDGTPLETIQKEKLKLIIQDLAENHDWDFDAARDSVRDDEEHPLWEDDCV